MLRDLNMVMEIFQSQYKIVNIGGHVIMLILLILLLLQLLNPYNNRIYTGCGLLSLHR